MEKIQAGKVAFLDLRDEARWTYGLAKGIGAGIEDLRPISLVTLVGSNVDANRPIVAGSVEADHSNFRTLVNGHVQELVWIFEGALKPRQVSDPVGRPDRLAHRDCLGIIAPNQDIKRIVHCGASDLHRLRTPVLTDKVVIKTARFRSLLPLCKSIGQQCSPSGAVGSPGRRPTRRRWLPGIRLPDKTLTPHEQKWGKTSIQQLGELPLTSRVVQSGVFLAGLGRALLAACRMPVLFNAARGKSISQRASASQTDSTPDDAGPCRVVDLEREWPIHAIHLRRKAQYLLAERANVAVSISTDGKRWHLVRSGPDYHGIGTSREPLEIQLLGRCRARFVRLKAPTASQAGRFRMRVLVSRGHSPGPWRILRRVRRWLRSQRSQHASVRHAPALVDVARHATTSVRAVHPAGVDLAARGEARTLYTLDLQSEWPIHRIHIDRSAREPNLSSHVVVSISRDATEWDRVFEGHHFFDAPGRPNPLELLLASQHVARFVRLDLPGDERASSHVKILAEQRLIALGRSCEQYGFPYDRMLAVDGTSRFRYAVENAPSMFDGRIDSFHVTTKVGRFGNNVRSIANAVCLARRTGATKIYIPHFSQLRIGEPIEAEGLTLMHEHSLRSDRPAAVLTGAFYYREAFGKAANNITPEEFSWAIHAFVRPILDRGAPAPSLVPAGTDLTIHLRAGDLFSRRAPHSGYVQPPLSFYQLIVRHALEKLGTQRVVMVYEDEGNPCVGALRDWLRTTNIPYVAQSKSLAEDIAVLRHSRHCVFGYGTFGPAVVSLSDTIETVFLPWTMGGQMKNGQFAGVRVVQVDDLAGQYMKPDTWRGSPEQRKMMIDYPINNLAISENPGDHDVELQAT